MKNKRRTVDTGSEMPAKKRMIYIICEFTSISIKSCITHQFRQISSIVTIVRMCFRRLCFDRTHNLMGLVLIGSVCLNRLPCYRWIIVSEPVLLKITKDCDAITHIWFFHIVASITEWFAWKGLGKRQTIRICHHDVDAIFPSIFIARAHN